MPVFHLKNHCGEKTGQNMPTVKYFEKIIITPQQKRCALKYDLVFKIHCPSVDGYCTPPGDVATSTFVLWAERVPRRRASTTESKPCKTGACPLIPPIRKGVRAKRNASLTKDSWMKSSFVNVRCLILRRQAMWCSRHRAEPLSVAAETLRSDSLF